MKFRIQVIIANDSIHPAMTKLEIKFVPLKAQASTKWATTLKTG